MIELLRHAERPVLENHRDEEARGRASEAFMVELFRDAERSVLRSDLDAAARDRAAEAS